MLSHFLTMKTNVFTDKLNCFYRYYYLTVSMGKDLNLEKKLLSS